MLPEDETTADYTTCVTTTTCTQSNDKDTFLSDIERSSDGLTLYHKQEQQLTHVHNTHTPGQYAGGGGSVGSNEPRTQGEGSVGLSEPPCCTKSLL